MNICLREWGRIFVYTVLENEEGTFHAITSEFIERIMKQF